jgi:Arc/MetJ-type ribon-helix-helix transcriptional regulator
MIDAFPPDLQRFVSEEVASGHYRTEDELLVEAVRFYRDSAVRRRELRDEINARLRQLDRGEAIEIADDAALDVFIDQIGIEVPEELTREQGQRA